MGGYSIMKLEKIESPEEQLMNAFKNNLDYWKKNDSTFHNCAIRLYRITDVVSALWWVDMYFEEIQNSSMNTLKEEDEFAPNKELIDSHIEEFYKNLKHYYKQRDYWIPMSKVWLWQNKKKN